MLTIHRVIAIALKDKGLAHDAVWYDFAIETKEGTVNLRFFTDTGTRAQEQLKAIAASLEPQSDPEPAGAPNEERTTPN